MNVPSYADQSTMLVRWGQPMVFHRRPGEFVVMRGRLWLTRRGDLDDHMLEPGQKVVVGDGDAVVVEPWERGERSEIAWQPYGRPALGGLPRDAAVFGLRGVAAAAEASADGLRRAAGALAALARNAASMARRAQGCICSGESTASAGALQ